MANIPDSNFLLHRDQYPLYEYAVNSGQTPRYLYKYMTYEGLMRFLGNGKLLFARYDMLNDPFEFQANVDTKNSYNEWLAFLLGNQVPKALARMKAKEMVSNSQYAAEAIKEAINMRLEIDGILCLTSKPTNLLMWAHYADSHTGVCLKFDMLADLDTFYFPKKVDYNQKYLEYNYLKDNSKACEALFRKSPDWEYEDEYRVLKPNGYGLRRVRNCALASIIFGCRFDESKIQDVMKATNTIGFNPSYKRAVQSKTEYKIDILDM